jgi:gliding motility-associated lipoprotein GldD
MMYLSRLFSGKPFFFLFITGLLLLMLLMSCEPPVPRARPYGYHRISFPDSIAYQDFSNPYCPFSFPYPASATITRSMQDSCWIDIYFPSYDLKWHLTYRSIPESDRPLSGHFEEYRQLVYKHTKKATQILSHPFQQGQVTGTAWEVYGNVGTPAYYFVTDSSREHLLLSSFYFNTALKNDSLAPVIDYMKGEMEKALGQVEWKR